MAAFWTRLLRVKLIYLLILLGFATNGYSQNVSHDLGDSSFVCKPKQLHCVVNEL